MLILKSFLEEVENLKGPGYESKARRQRKIDEEKKIRQQILRNSYLQHMTLLQEIEFLRASLSGYLQLTNIQTPEMFLGSFYLDKQSDNIIYASEPDENGLWQMLGPGRYQKTLATPVIGKIQEKFPE